MIQKQLPNGCQLNMNCFNAEINLNDRFGTIAVSTGFDSKSQQILLEIFWGSNLYKIYDFCWWDDDFLPIRFFLWNFPIPKRTKFVSHVSPTDAINLSVQSMNMYREAFRSQQIQIWYLVHRYA